MKDLFDRLAGLRPPSELGWVGTVSAVFVIVSVVMILVYLAMAAANAAEADEEKCRVLTMVSQTLSDGTQIGRLVVAGPCGEGQEIAFWSEAPVCPMDLRT